MKIRLSTLFSALIVLPTTGKNRLILDSLLLTGLIVMPQKIRARQPRAFACRCLFVAFFASGLMGCPLSPTLHAESPAVRGYITAVHPPNGFDVNGEHVTTTAETQFGPIGTKNPVRDGPMRDAVQIGAWVEVVGDEDRNAKTLTTRIVFFKGDDVRMHEGLGLIVRVIATTPDLVFAADGYIIRLTPETEISLAKNMKSQTDLRAGQWVTYEGKLDHSGLLVAGKVRFLADKQMQENQGQGSADSSHPSQTPPGDAGAAAKDISSPPNDALCQTGDVAIGGDEILLGNYKVSGYPTYKITKDRVLQSRVRRIGISLIPDYQNRLAPEDPSKIHFLFCVVDDGAREEFTSPATFQAGWIMVPAQLAMRFKSDDQLAAVLADGIALSLQKQAPPVIQVTPADVVEAAGLVGANFIPGGGLVAYAVASSTFGKYVDRAADEQHERIALQLMADAGYDPWQAPEAWRLAKPKKLPADTSTLKYPDRSGYQLSILNLMYKKPAPTHAAESGSTADVSAGGKP
jgi:hypothetical protein